MPANTGKEPLHPIVDIKYRNGVIVRSVKPPDRRWKPWDWGQSDWDIVSWQPGGEG